MQKRPDLVTSLVQEITFHHKRESTKGVVQGIHLSRTAVAIRRLALLYWPKNSSGIRRWQLCFRFHIECADIWKLAYLRIIIHNYSTVLIDNKVRKHLQHFSNFIFKGTVNLNVISIISNIVNAISRLIKFQRNGNKQIFWCEIFVYWWIVKELILVLIHVCFWRSIHYQSRKINWRQHSLYLLVLGKRFP